MLTQPEEWERAFKGAKKAVEALHRKGLLELSGPFPYLKWETIVAQEIASAAINAIPESLGNVPEDGDITEMDGVTVERIPELEPEYEW
jgi:hypothetical protein